MKYIDLHVHTTASDGTFTPEEVVEEAYKQNLTALAITDHDTIQGVKCAVDYGKKMAQTGKPIEVVSGVELSVEYKKRDIHMLGLMIDYENTSFIKALDDAQAERSQRNDKMVENLADAGIDITMDELKKLSGDAVITRAHFGKLLLQKKYVKTLSEAFDKYLGEDGPYYVPRKYITPEDGIDLIRSAGGIPILAHPLLYKLPDEELDTLVHRLKNHGLMGIETIYSGNTGFDEGIVRRYANKYDLLITGGSDFHGANKPLIKLGVGRGNLKVPYSILEDLKKAKEKL